MNKTMKRMLALALALMMCLSVAVPAFAEDLVCPGEGMEHMKSNCSYEFIRTHEQTCGKPGYSLYQCKKCGGYFNDDITAPYGGECDYVVTKPATCQAPGEETCSKCGDVQVIKQLEHDFVWADGKDPKTTCYSYPGEMATGVCKYECGVTATVALEAHVWGDEPTSIIKWPSCNPTLVDPAKDLEEGEELADLNGEAQFTCQRCAAKNNVVILALDHHNIEYVELYDATCYTDGVQIKEGYEQYVITMVDGKQYGIRCTVCGIDTTEVVKGEHSFGEEPSSEQLPTCTTYGFKKYNCVTCGYMHTERIAPYNHKDAVLLPGSTGAICGTNGCDHYYCPTCGLYYDVYAPNYNRHYWESKKIEATCSEPTIVWEECVNCGMVVNEQYVGIANAELHDWVEVEAKYVAPTCTEFGKREYACSICGAEMKVAINPLGHDLDEDNDGIDDMDDERLPFCGGDGSSSGVGVYYYNCETCGSQISKPGATFDSTNPLHHGFGRGNATADVTELTPDEALAQLGAVDAKAPTCTEAGKTYYRCNYCTRMNENGTAVGFAVEVPALGHVNKDGHSPNSKWYPTVCYETVTIEHGFKCVNPGCNFTYNKGTYTAVPVDSMLRHNMVIGGSATCGEVADMICTHELNIVNADGDIVLTVDANGDPIECTYTYEVELEHIYKTYTCTDLATGKTLTALRDNDCEQYGFRYLVCENCGDEIIDWFEYATGHNIQEILPDESTDDPYDFIVKGVADGDNHWVNPDCTNPGFKVEACVNVHTSRYNYVPEVDQNGNVVKDANGYVVYTDVLVSELCQDNKTCDPLVKPNCPYYGPYWTESVVAPLQHMDANGNPIYCTDANGNPIVEDVLCFRDCCCTCENKDILLNCPGHLVEWESLHKWVHTIENVSCEHYLYELHVCTVCEYDYTTPIVDENGHFVPGAHNWDGALMADSAKVDFSKADWYKTPGVKINYARWDVLKAATYTEAGTLYFKCNNHIYGCKEIITVPYTLDDIKFTLSHDNGLVAGADVVNSGVLKVDVEVSAYDIYLYSIDLNVGYDSSKLEFIGYEISDYAKDLVGESGVWVGTAYKDNIGLYFANNGETPTNVHLEKEDKEVLITLIFNVYPDVNDGTHGFTNTSVVIKDASVLDADLETKVKSNLSDPATKVRVETLGNVTMGTIESSELKVDDYDARAMVEMIMTANSGYLATADIDQDGDVDLADYVELAKYVAAGSTYAELCLNGYPVELD